MKSIAERAKTSQNTMNKTAGNWIVLVWFALFFGAFAFSMSSSHFGSGSPFPWIWASVPSIIIVAIFTAVTSKEKRRLQTIEEGLRKQGWKFLTKPDLGAAKSELHSHESVLDWLGWESFGQIEWLAVKEDAVLYEHYWVVSRGKSSQEFWRTGFLKFDSGLSELAGLTLFRPNWLQGRRLRDVTVPLEDREMADHWAATTAHPRGLATALGGSRRGEMWCFGRDCVAGEYERRASFAEIQLLLDKEQAFRSFLRNANLTESEAQSPQDHVQA